MSGNIGDPQLSADWDLANTHFNYEQLTGPEQEFYEAVEMQLYDGRVLSQQQRDKLTQMIERIA